MSTPTMFSCFQLVLQRWCRQTTLQPKTSKLVIPRMKCSNREALVLQIKKKATWNVGHDQNLTVTLWPCMHQCRNDQEQTPLFNVPFLMSLWYSTWLIGMAGYGYISHKSEFRADLHLCFTHPAWAPEHVSGCASFPTSSLLPEGHEPELCQWLLALACLGYPQACFPQH